MINIIPKIAIPHITLFLFVFLYFEEEGIFFVTKCMNRAYKSKCVDFLPIKNIFFCEKSKFLFFYKNMCMLKNILLLSLFVIFLMSLLTFFFIIHYLDPYKNTVLAVIAISLNVNFLLTSFFTLCIYFFKKVYYRWEVFVTHIFSSLRQGILLSFFLFSMLVCMVLGIVTWYIFVLLFITFVFIELLFQNL